MRDAPSWRLPIMHNTSSRNTSPAHCALAHVPNPPARRQIVRPWFRRAEELVFGAVVVTSYGFARFLEMCGERVTLGSQRMHTFWARKAQHLERDRVDGNGEQGAEI